ncbi:Arc family DNA-binding protein [candidate division KSB1 bacterium]|nr:Arc family DNA-binding protein [candidate division KSB1 bacterium]
MHNITIKNVPEELYEKIKITAKENRRSINNEIIKRLGDSLSSKKIDIKNLFSTLDNFYKNTNIPPLTDAIINEAKEEGRK